MASPWSTRITPYFGRQLRLIASATPKFRFRFLQTLDKSLSLMAVSEQPVSNAQRIQMLNAQIHLPQSATSPDARSDHLLPSTCRLEVIDAKTLLRVLSQPLSLPLVKVASVLSSRRGTIVTREEFATEIWGEFASGGPLSAETMIGQYVAVLRAHGLQIATFRARGYGVGLP